MVQNLASPKRSRYSPMRATGSAHASAIPWRYKAPRVNDGTIVTILGMIVNSKAPKASFCSQCCLPYTQPRPSSRGSAPSARHTPSDPSISHSIEKMVYEMGTRGEWA